MENLGNRNDVLSGENFLTPTSPRLQDYFMPLPADPASISSAGAYSVTFSNQESELSIETMDEDLMEEAVALSLAIPLMNTMQPNSNHGDQDKEVLLKEKEEEVDHGQTGFAANESRMTVLTMPAQESVPAPAPQEKTVQGSISLQNIDKLDLRQTEENTPILSNDENKVLAERQCSPSKSVPLSEISQPILLNIEEDNPEMLLREVLDENRIFKHAVCKAKSRLYLLRAQLNASKENENSQLALLEKMARKIEESGQEMKMLQARIVELEKEKEELDAGNKTRDRRIDELTAAMADHNAAEVDTSSLQRDYNDLKNVLELCRQDLEQEEEKTGHLRAANRRLREDHEWVEAQKEKAGRMALQMDEQEREITRLTHAEEAMQRELTTLKQSSKVDNSLNLQRSCKELEARLSMEVSQISKLEMDLKRAQEENEILVFTNNSINQIQAIMHKDMDGLEERLKEKEQEARVVDAKALSAAQDAEKARKELEELKLQLVIKTELCKDKENQAQELQAHLESQRCLVKDLQLKLVDKENEVSALSIEKESDRALWQTNEELKREVTELRNRIWSQEQLMMNLRTKMIQQANEFNRISLDNSIEHDGKVKRLVTELEEQKKLLFHLKRKYNVLKGKYSIVSGTNFDEISD